MIKIAMNPETDVAYGRNGLSKLKALSIWAGDSTVFFEGINSRDTVISQCGFNFAANAAALWEISSVTARMAACQVRDIDGDGQIDQMVQAMVSAHYVISPNNIFGLPGHLMYAGGPGIWTVADDLEVQVLQDRIRVFKAKFFGTPYSRQSYWDTSTVAVFGDVPAFLKWCEANGKLSEPGIAAHPQNYD